MRQRPLGLPRADCTAVVLDGRVSLHCPDTGKVHTLSETATAVWRLLDGRRGVDDVVAGLAQHYSAPVETLRTDVLSVVRELGRSRVLTDFDERRT